MDYSFSTVYMAVIASNILLVLLVICFGNRNIRNNTGYKLLAVFIVFTAARFVLPLELPFTKTFLLPTPVSFILSYIQHPFIKWGMLRISLWTILQVTWIGVFVYKLIRHIRLQRKLSYDILSACHDFEGSEKYRDLMDRVCAERNRKNPFLIRKSPHVTVPMLYGVFHPYILLPENVTILDHQMYYVFCHEASHHFHRDLLIKNIMHLICIFYWWNPFCYILKKQMDSVLEMRIDEIVAKNPEDVPEYLSCLLLIAESSTEEKEKSEDPVSKSSLLDDESELTARFQMLLDRKKKKHSWNIALLALTLVIFAGSYLVIFEAHYIDPATKAELILIDEENTYIIEKADDTYDIYLKGQFIENTESLQYYNPEIPVYTEKEFHDETN